MILIYQVVLHKCGAGHAVLHGLMYAEWKDTGQPVRLSLHDGAAIMGCTTKTINKYMNKLTEMGYIIPTKKGKGERIKYIMRDMV